MEPWNYFRDYCAQNKKIVWDNNVRLIIHINNVGFTIHMKLIRIECFILEFLFGPSLGYNRLNLFRSK